MVGLLAHSLQVYAGEEVAKIEQFENIYKNRAENLTKQFAHYLAELYPEQEKNIFEKISPKDLDVYLVKYPNLRSSETIVALVKQIRSLEDDYYGQKILKAERLKEMRFRTKNPWVMQWMMPKLDIPNE
jgi:hypothetical protein